MWFDPRISQMQGDGVNFLQMIPPYSLAYPVHQFGTSTHPLAVVSNNSVPVTGQHATPVVKHKENALVLSPGFGMNMSYTQMLLAAESEDPLFGSPHTEYYPVGAENETFMVNGRNTRLSELVDMDNPESSNYIEQDDPSNWNNNQTDFQEADLALQTVTWDDGVPAPGAELLQALGICPDQNEDDTCSEDSDTDPSAFNNVLVVAEEDANRVVAGHGDEHGDNEAVDDDVNQFSPDDTDNFLENDSVLAAQTCSQEVRSRHVPQRWVWTSKHRKQHKHSTRAILACVDLLCEKHQTTVAKLAQGVASPDVFSDATGLGRCLMRNKRRLGGNKGRRSGKSELES
nr:uncharacterized protein LOC109760988 isoform X2 [Aegilops tauschii subsp. strangulata]